MELSGVRACPVFGEQTDCSVVDNFSNPVARNSSCQVFFGSSPSAERADLLRSSVHLVYNSILLVGDERLPSSYFPVRPDSAYAVR